MLPRSPHNLKPALSIKELSQLRVLEQGFNKENILTPQSFPHFYENGGGSSEEDGLSRCCIGQLSLPFSAFILNFVKGKMYNRYFDTMPVTAVCAPLMPVFPQQPRFIFFFFYRYFFLVLVFRFLIIFQYSFYIPACIFKPFLPTFLLICIFTDTFIFFFSSFKSQETTILSFNIID